MSTQGASEYWHSQPPLSAYGHYDKVTGEPCHIIHNRDGYCWVLLEGKTRPRTRRSVEVITIVEREKQVAERLASQRAARAVPFIPSIHKDAEVVRLESIVELLQSTLKWVVKDSSAARRNYNKFGNPLVGLGNTQAPDWVMDVLRVADKA